MIEALWLAFCVYFIAIVWRARAVCTYKAWCRYVAKLDKLAAGTIYKFRIGWSMARRFMLLVLLPSLALAAVVEIHGAGDPAVAFHDPADATTVASKATGTAHATPSVTIVHACHRSGLLRRTVRSGETRASSSDEEPMLLPSSASSVSSPFSARRQPAGAGFQSIVGIAA